MLFNSLEFLFFLPTVFILYFLIPHKSRWILLLGASYYFYMSWKPAYIILILTSTFIDYLCSIQLGKEQSKLPRKLFLWASILTNLCILLTFKYLGFFQEIANDLSSVFGHQEMKSSLSLILPMGISFYTFQTMSYTIDVYNKKIKPEMHLGKFALFVTFFPQLVAGPIERASSLLPQLRKQVNFNYQQITGGLKLMAWGMFKKVVIADRLSVFVETVFNSPYDYEGIPLIIGTVFFAIQIYCDFSGYSDIAIGTAQLFGISLMVNFRRPYHAHNISDFWSRWHVSLSTWFRDYCYIPLGGNRVVKWRWYYNLFVTFLISGLWHGANWTFVLWGAFHGTLLIIEVLFNLKEPRKSRTGKYAGITLTFILVCIGWILFRANNIKDAIYIISSLLKGIPENIDAIVYNVNFGRSEQLYLGQDKWVLFIAIGSIILMEIIHILQRHNGMRQMLSSYPPFIKWSLYYIIIISIMLFGVFEESKFIYFQF